MQNKAFSGTFGAKVEQFYLCTLKVAEVENKSLNLESMEQSYIFDFCSLFDMEQDKDVKSYIQQQRNKNKVR